MIERVQRWASASGRTVTQPGIWSTVQPRFDLSFILVLIVSYETLRTLQPYLANVEVGLLLCDEGHRLKNGGKFGFVYNSKLSSYRWSRLLNVHGSDESSSETPCYSLGDTDTGSLLLGIISMRANLSSRMISPSTFLFSTSPTLTSLAPGTIFVRTLRTQSCGAETPMPLTRTKKNVKKSFKR